jgi:hypothetical protein
MALQAMPVLFSAGILLLSLILPDEMGGLHTDRDEYGLVSLSIILLFQNQDA